MTGYRCLQYVFGLGGHTNTVYWSAYDPQGIAGYSQSYWEAVEVEGLEDVREIVGAVPYSVAPDRRYIFLFMRRQAGRNEELVFARYDLENRAWAPSTTRLDVPENPPTFNAVVKQVDWDDEPPHLALRIFDPAAYAQTFERHLNADGDGWEEDDFALLSELHGATVRFTGMVAKGRNAFYTFSTVPDGIGTDIYCSLWQPNPGYVPNKTPLNPRYYTAKMTTFDFARYRGAFGWGGTDDVYLVTSWPLVHPFGLPGTNVWLIQDTGAPNLSTQGVHTPFTSSDKPIIVPTAGLTDDPTTKTKRFVYQSAGAAALSDRFLRGGRRSLFRRTAASHALGARPLRHPRTSDFGPAPGPKDPDPDRLHRQPGRAGQQPDLPAGGVLLRPHAARQSRWTAAGNTSPPWTGSARSTTTRRPRRLGRSTTAWCWTSRSPTTGAAAPTGCWTR